MKRVVIIVAGGSGTRMGGVVPKQFLELVGRPVLMRTIERFYQFDNTIRIILVLPENQISYWKKLCLRHNFSIKYELTYGGATRYESVRNGYSLIKEPAVVGIHDGVRPLVSNDTLQRCYEDAEIFGNAVPVTTAIESVRICDADTKNRAVDRDTIRLVQTPQVFTTAILDKAFSIPYRDSFTDDASVAEAAGFDIHLTKGNRENIKLTTPFDMQLATMIISQEFSEE